MQTSWKGVPSTNIGRWFDSIRILHGCMGNWCYIGARTTSQPFNKVDCSIQYVSSMELSDDGVKRL
jgi:hypothetical protein